MKLKILFVFLFVVVLGLLVKFFLVEEKAPKTQLLYETVALRDIRTTISATGTLEPVDQVEIGTQVSGDIAKIRVDFNDRVKKGEILAELDKSKLQATLVQAEIALQAAENDFSYKSNVLNRVKKLAENGSASAVELENAEYDFRTSELSVKRAKNEVAQARLNLSYCTIKSPINGIVLERAVDVGQTVAASMSAPTLFILAKDLSKMKVMASVDEADIGSVSAGQKVEFFVDAFIDETFNGMVQEVRLNPVTTSNVVTYTVVIEAENPELKLLPGMTATCTIITQEEQNVLSVSLKALKYKPNISSTDVVPRNFPEKDKPKAMKIPKKNRGLVFHSENGKIKPVSVETGISDGVYTAVVSGISEGDSLVIGEEFLDKKMPQKNVEAKSPFMPGPPGKKRK
jgi:HlyD family secretion protein